MIQPGEDRDVPKRHRMEEDLRQVEEWEQGDSSSGDVRVSSAGDLGVPSAGDEQEDSLSI